jgi:hypothetical protein
MPMRTVIDRGPKGKRVVAFALDWPGWSRGAKTAEDAVATLERYRGRALQPYRDAYVAAMQAYNAGEVERRMRKRTLPFLIRHTCFHTLDHAWEMEDKDLT